MSESIYILESRLRSAVIEVAKSRGRPKCVRGLASERADDH
jgi:hypothetical protein